MTAIEESKLSPEAIQMLTPHPQVEELITNLSVCLGLYTHTLCLGEILAQSPSRSSHPPRLFPASLITHSEEKSVVREKWVGKGVRTGGENAGGFTKQGVLKVRCSRNTTHTHVMEGKRGNGKRNPKQKTPRTMQNNIATAKESRQLRSR